MLKQKDIEGLPPELLAQLSKKAIAQTENPVLASIRQREIASIDQIMIDIYRSTGQVKKRQAVSMELFKLAKAGLIARIPKHQGVYRIAASKEPGQ